MAKKMNAAQRVALEVQAATEAAELLTQRDAIYVSEAPWRNEAGKVSLHVQKVRVRVNRDYGHRVEADIVEILSETGRPPESIACRLGGAGWVKRFESMLIAEGTLKYL